MNKAQQLRIASALAGLSAPPKGAAMVRQDDQKPRIDKLAGKRAAASSVHTSSGGGYSAPPADGSKGSLRSDIKAAIDR